MTKAQTRKYWAEFRPVRERWLSQGALTAAETDARRHALQRKALGYDRSSAKLNNQELDAILAAFRAEAAPDDLDAQLDVQDSPERLRDGMLGRCNTAMLTLSPDGSRYGDDRSREGYLATIAKSVDSDLRWPPLSTETLRKVMGIVETRAAILRRKAGQNLASQSPARRAAEPIPFDQDNPF